MKSYNVKDLQQLSTEHNFIRDNLEKVLRLSEILKYISTSSTLNGILALKGGTAIAFIPSMTITSLAPTELYGSKIKALLERAAARDLFDVYNFLHCGLPEKTDKDLLRKIVVFYQAVGGETIPNEQCDTSVIDHLQFKHIRAQLLPMLRKGRYFDFEIAKGEVKQFISELMVLTENDKKFIRSFARKKYHPEYLFESAEIIERIKEHPMALWKTTKK